MQAAVNTQNKGSPAQRQMAGVRRRILQIALLASCCLLLNLIVTIATSTALEEWSASSQVWLECSIYETPYVKSWDAYGFSDGQTACHKDSIVWVGNSLLNEPLECVSDCKYSATDLVLGARLSCDLAEGIFMDPTNSIPYGVCDCSCDDLIEVRAPAFAIQLLSHLSQSLVVTMVGLNLGFSKKNVDVWKKFSKSIGIKSTSVAAEGSSARPSGLQLQSSGDSSRADVSSVARA